MKFCETCTCGSHLEGAEMEVEKNVSSLGVPIHHKIE